MPVDENATKEPREAHRWVKEMTEGEKVSGAYLVKKKRLGTTRNGKTFIGLVLGDRSGDIDAKVWDRAEDLSGIFEQGDIIHVDGDTETYQGRRQIRVTEIRVCPDNMDPGLFMDAAPVDPSKMMQDLKKILKKVVDPHLLLLIRRFLADNEFVRLFKAAPAAKNFHHNYAGGLLEHTLAVCRMAVDVAARYPELDKDLLITGGFVHDIGKIRELKGGPGVDYSDEGRLLGHLVIGAGMIDEKVAGIKGFPSDLVMRLKHLILSHHGQFEFGSPKRPKFLEAFALNLIDDLDAKLNGIARFMDKDSTAGNWTDYNRLFGRFLLKGNPVDSERPGNDVSTGEHKQENLFGTGNP